jgi:hypothetical protein
MKTIGKKTVRPISLHANAELMAEGLRFNDEMIKMNPLPYIMIPKGVYRFKTHEEANLQWDEAIAQGMAILAKQRHAR